MKKAFLGAFLFVAMSAFQASAMTIDFTSSAWNPNPVTDTKTVGDVTVTSAPTLPLGALSQDSNGIGIASFFDLGGQVGTLEVLRVTFAHPFTLSSFVLSEFTRFETAHYSLDGGAWQDVSQGNTSATTKTISFAPTVVNTIFLGYDSFSLSDFRLKSITGDFQDAPPSVPEPTSMVLLGTGLAGLVVRKRRLRA
jgi:hypothetical protein